MTDPPDAAGSGGPADSGSNEDPPPEASGAAEPEEESRTDEPPEWLKDHENRQQERSDIYTSFAEAMAAFFPSGRLGATNFYGPVQIEDWVSGDKHVGHTSTVFAGSGQVPASVLRDIRDTFVHPERYQALCQRLTQRAVVILRAPAGWGRTTTALHALSDLYPYGVSKIRPEMDLTTLAVERLQKNHGYLAGHLEVSQVTELREYHLEEELAPKLRQRGCQLIITIDATTEFRDPALKDWVFDGGPPPDAHLIVERHLVHRSSDAIDPAEFMASQDIRSLVQESARSGFVARRLVELGTLLVGVRQGQIDVEQIRGQLSAELDDELSQWFKQQPDLEQRAFLLGLMAVNGMPQGTVFRISDTLADILFALESTEDDPPRPAFGATRTEMLDAAEAELFDVIEHGRYGNRHAVGLRFRDDTYPLWVLNHVWNEYPYLRPTLLQWISGLGADTERRVRVRAGVVAGLLSLFDFDLIRREVLLPWARDERVGCRETVLAALRPPAQHPEFAAAVNRMVVDWSRSESMELRWTAARALGVAVGSGMPEQALRVLGRLSDTDDAVLIGAVSDSLAELFNTRQEIAALVLDSLVKWSEPDPVRRPRRRAAGCYFVVLGLDNYVEPADASQKWPVLLWLASQDEAHFRRVSTLLGRVLDMPWVFVYAYELLRLWTSMASRHLPLRLPLERLVVSVSRSDGLKRQIEGHLRRWVSEDEDLADISAALLAALTEGTTTP